MSRRSRSFLFLPASLAAAAGASLAQEVWVEPRVEVHGDDVTVYGCPNFTFGNINSGMDVIRDVDGDGYDDIVVAARQDGGFGCGRSDIGSVTVVSGDDGSRIWSVPAVASNGSTISLSSIDDLNGDGTPDVLAVQDASIPMSSENGILRCYSGTDGQVLFTLDATSLPGHQNALRSVTRAGDLNDDGIEDFAVSALCWPVGDERFTCVFLLSGSDRSLLRTYTGPVGYDDEFGRTFDNAGDVDGDGIDDLVVGAAGRRDGNDNPVGSVTVFSGATGLQLAHRTGSRGQSLLRIGFQVRGLGDVTGDGQPDVGYTSLEGGTRNGHVFSVADGVEAYVSGAETLDAAGDVDGDGLGDVLFGLRLASAAGGGQSGGLFYVGAGGTFETLFFVRGETAFMHLGSRVVGGANLNGDRYADVVVSTSDDIVRLYPGRPRGRRIARIDGSSGDAFGTSVDAAGDVDGDGFGDVVAGAPLHDGNGSNAGRVLVLSPVDGRVLHTFDGLATGDRLGLAVAGAGDVNGDGYDDVILGAPHADLDAATPDTGLVQVRSGLDGSVLFAFHGAQAGDRLGSSLSGAVDVDGDGVVDILAGAPHADSGGLADSGAAVLFSGLDGSVLHTWSGAAAGDLFGGAVSVTGDVNGDGWPDVLVGAEGSDVSGTDSGSATVFSGAGYAELFTLHGTDPLDHFGRAVSGAGDVNRDGLTDLIIGAPGVDTGSGGRGWFAVYAGPDGAPLHGPFHGSEQPHGIPRERLGTAVDGPGDLNGDGFADLIVSGPRLNRVRVYSGRDGTSLIGALSGDDGLLGGSLAGAGDVDGDGRVDVVVGAPPGDSVYVYDLGYPRVLPTRRKRIPPPTPTW